MTAGEVVAYFVWAEEGDIDNVVFFDVWWEIELECIRVNDFGDGVWA